MMALQTIDRGDQKINKKTWWWMEEEVRVWIERDLEAVECWQAEREPGLWQRLKAGMKGAIIEQGGWGRWWDGPRWGVPLSPRLDGKEQRQDKIQLKFDRRIYTNTLGISLVGEGERDVELVDDRGDLEAKYESYILIIMRQKSFPITPGVKSLRMC